MKLLQAVTGAQVYIYAEGKEMPIKRYTLFQKYLLMEAGIGSDMESMSAHFTRLYGFISEAMQKEALGECENLHFNIYSILNEINFGSLAFACLVARIDNEVINDLSEDGLRRTIDRISELELSVAEMEASTDEVKKKIGEELKLYFPRIFPDESYSFFASIKQRIILTGELLLSTDEENEGIVARLRELSRFFLNQSKPGSFRADDPGNCVVELEKSFGVLCAVLDNNGTTNSQEMTAFDFYSRLEYLSKPQQK